MKLALWGLPRTKWNPRSTGSEMMGKTSSEQKQLRKRMLEGSLMESFRSLEGVDSCYFRSCDPESFFQDDAEPDLAVVMLGLKDGRQLTEQEVLGIVHLC